jgi:hypothetical protein
MEKEIEKKEAEQSLIKKLSLINQNDLLFLKNKKDKIIVTLFFLYSFIFRNEPKQFVSSKDNINTRKAISHVKPYHTFQLNQQSKILLH